MFCCFVLFRTMWIRAWISTHQSMYAYCSFFRNSALKFLFRASAHPKLRRNTVESYAKILFVSPGRFVHQTIQDTLESAYFSDDENDEEKHGDHFKGKTYDVRFVALIERIFDLISHHGIALEHPFTIALYCILDDQRIKFLSI